MNPAARSESRVTGTVLAFGFKGLALFGSLLDRVHDNLRQARHRLEQLGYDDYFYRLWEFYLCYCEGGFLERTIGTAQLLLAKPGARPAPLLGHFGA